MQSRTGGGAQHSTRFATAGRAVAWRVPLAATGSTRSRLGCGVDLVSARMPARSRLGRSYLLALSAFLVPLAILAVLGFRELQRSGDLARAATEGEAREFLARARQAIEQAVDSRLPAVLAESERLLLEHGPVRTTLQLRGQEGAAPLRNLVMLDAQLDLAWPMLPVFSVNLPLASDARQPDTGARSSLQAADLLLTRGELPAAIALLTHLIETLQEANPQSGRSRRPDLEETEIIARFRLGTALRSTGDHDGARAEFDRVLRFAANLRSSAELGVYGLLAEAALAELGSSSERLRLLRAIAENHRERHADGMLTAVAHRLAARFPAADPARAEVDELLREEQQRAATRTFAALYEIVLKYGLRLRRLRQAGGDAGSVDRLIATVDGQTMLLRLRPATAAESERWRCAFVGLQFDLAQLLGPALHAFADTDGTFALAVEDPDGADLVPPPDPVPSDFVAPAIECLGLTLRAFPADPARLAAEATAAVLQRTLLLIVLLATALGGALWSWRSVSREAELAALKIELVSRVSHELKTPLALIRMYGETLGLGRARDSNQAADFGNIIVRESERLTALIQRILDFSRQQAGTLAYSPQPHDLGELLRPVVAAYSPHLQARGVVLIDSLPSDILVRCDANACESAIVNLLENAAKYGRDDTEEDHEVEFVLAPERGRAVLEVRDRGRGIPTAERERVFDGFYRASNAGEVRGAGLGLSLVRHFARAHGGDIEALPNPGGGTIMRLWLPLASSSSSSSSQPADPSQPPPPPARDQSQLPS